MDQENQTPQPEVIQISKEDLAALISKEVDSRIANMPKTDSNLESVLRDLTKELRRDSTETSGTVKDYEIDTTDYLEEEALFFSYSFSYGVYGDVRLGQQVDTPYGRPIKFKPLYRYKKPGSGRSDSLITTSVAKIRSRRELDFLLNHSLFGIKFFRTQSEVADLDTAHADKLVEVSYMLNAMTEHEVIQRAKSEKLTIDTPDVGVIKKRLTYHLADKEMKSSRKIGQPKPVDSSWTPDRLEEALEKQDY